MGALAGFLHVYAYVFCAKGGSTDGQVVVNESCISMVRTQRDELKGQRPYRSVGKIGKKIDDVTSENRTPVVLLVMVEHLLC